MPQELYFQIKSLYDQYGNEKYMIDEEITQQSHVLQAAQIASLAGAPEDVVIGLLLHDVGQISNKNFVGNVNLLHAEHDVIGSNWLLENGFPQFVCDVVRFHTIAKVVLCLEDPGYFNTLSSASKDSYFIQKSKYFSETNQEPLTTFLNHPRKDDILHARKIDDMSKIVDLNVIPNKQGIYLRNFDDYYAMALRVYEGNGKPATNPRWKECISQFHSLMVKDPDAFETYTKDNIRKVNYNPK